jgi:hypothetical protein
MGGGIYLIQDDDRLIEMSEQAYTSEEQLQELIEQYPHLLAGEQIDVAIPRQWLLVNREAAASSEDEASGRWSLDRLFLDRHAIPTFVEVRRLNNSRIRQESIGQMLDYVANANVYWSIDTIVTQFEANCREQGRDPEQVFEGFLGSDANEERFWEQVKTHLQAGKIRLIFVADEIPIPMRRVVEFLNEQVDPAEVLALEVKQYVDTEEGLRLLTPRLIGQTAEARQKKTSATRERRRWDESSFFQEFEVRRGSEEAKVARQIYEWSISIPLLDVVWGKGDTYGGFTVRPSYTGSDVSLFSLGIWGGLEISSSSYGKLRPFDSKEKWAELRGKFGSIGLALPTNPGETRFPYLRLATLQATDTREQVFQIFDWVMQEIEAG